MKVTLLHISLMIHYYALAEPVPNETAPAVIACTTQLLENGLIYVEPTSRSGYRATEKGTVWIQMLKSTPLPVPSYKDPRT